MSKTNHIKHLPELELEITYYRFVIAVLLFNMIV